MHERNSCWSCKPHLNDPLSLSFLVFVSKAAGHTNKRSNRKCPSNLACVYSFFFLHLVSLYRPTQLFINDCSLPLLSVLQESPGRAASGSPRPAGRAGQPTVPGGSPMAAVKKPDPNMKGRSSETAHFHFHTRALRVICCALVFPSLYQELDLSFPLNSRFPLIVSIY